MQQPSQCEACQESITGECLIHIKPDKPKDMALVDASDYIHKSSYRALYEILEALLQSNGCTQRPLSQAWSNNIATCNFCDEPFNGHHAACVWLRAHSAKLEMKDKLS